MRAFLAHRLAPLGAFVTGLVALLVGLGPALSPYDPTHMDVLAFLMPPDWQHPFGTDALGRDVLTRVLAGPGCRWPSVLRALLSRHLPGPSRV